MAALVVGVPGHPCQSQTLSLVGDLDNCHLFYQCDQTRGGQARSCGDMMFNTATMVCDWPSRVMQIRQECRDQGKLGLDKYPFYKQR